MSTSSMQLDSLRRIVQEVDAAPTLHGALETMVEQVSDTMHVDVCSVYLLDEVNQRYVLMASKGLNPDVIGEAYLSKGEGLVGLVGQREEIINLAEASTHPRFHYLEGTNEEQYHAFLGVPIMYRRKVMGVMVVQQRQSQEFTEAAESFLVTLCAQISGVIAHAHAVGQVDVFRKPSSGPSPRIFNGVPGSSGIAIGRAMVLFPAADIDLVPDRPAEDIQEELELLRDAVQARQASAAPLAKRFRASLPAETPDWACWNVQYSWTK